MTSAAWLAAGGAGLGAVLLILIRFRIWAARRLRGAPADLPVPAAVAPEALLHRVELRMEAIEALQTALAARLEALGSDDAAERRLQAMAGQILGMVRDKDASLDVALAGLDQLRARMRVLEQIGDLAEARALFERAGVRLDAVEAAQARAETSLETRLGGLEAASSPFAEVSDQLTRLYAQKDATVETVFARLGPLEAKLAEVEGALAARDPAAALERFGARLEAMQGRLAGLEGAENPYREIADQLTRLYAQKDATVETVFARLGPLEAKLAEVEGALAARDPAAALEGFGARLEAMQGRLAGLEGAENPYREIADQLTRLYAQKDATVETVFARLGPLEAKLAEVDPAAALERFGERLEAMQGRLAGLEGAENPYREIADQLTRLYAQKDATVETVFARLGPLEARLTELERAGADDGAEAARAEAQAIAAQLIAARTVTEETRLFASRIALLEASLPQLSLAQALMMQALERQAAAEVAQAQAAEVAAAPAHEAVAESEEDALWRLPRVVSVHTG